MGTTYEHVQVPTADAPAKRPGLLTLIAEAVGAARAISTADAGSSVTIARRFADRVS